MSKEGEIPLSPDFGSTAGYLPIKESHRQMYENFSLSPFKT